MVRCRPFSAADAPAWDRFVTAQPAATFFHLAGWCDVIARAFRHPTHYLLAEQDGAITGVLPLVHVRSRLFGRALISNPFCVYGGPLTVDAESARALSDHAAALLQSTGAASLEFRCREGEPGAEGWVQRAEALYVTFRKPIAADAVANLMAIPRKQRAVIRKGTQNGLTAVDDPGVDRLHHIYAESVRNLGTPVFARSYFRILREVFGEQARVLTVLDDGKPIASVLNFYFREEVLPYYGGGTRVARVRAGNDFMYWEVLRRAGEAGYRLFDFGRSKVGTGAFAFKKNLGFSPAPLHYRYKLRPGAALPDHNPLNPKYRLFIAGWKRLPLPVAKLLGPPIVRAIG
jgi:FemAB-related protein (PEP-CTERM system-associated)